MLLLRYHHGDNLADWVHLPLDVQARKTHTAFDIVRIDNTYINVDNLTKEGSDSDEDLDKESRGEEE
mgnify:FL=1